MNTGTEAIWHGVRGQSPEWVLMGLLVGGRFGAAPTVSITPPAPPPIRKLH
jgi:hypothetical protein